MRTIIRIQLACMACLIGLRKSQNISDGRPAEAINALVIIPHHEDLLRTAPQKTDELLLDEIRILILIDHDVPDPFLQLVKDLRIGRKKRICLLLQAGEINEMPFLFEARVLHHHSCEYFYAPAQLIPAGPPHLFRQEQLLGETIHIAADRLALAPWRDPDQLPLLQIGVLYHTAKIRDRRKFLQMLIHQVLLLKLVHRQIILRKMGILLKLFQDLSANVMEGTDVHLMQIHLDARLRQHIRETRRQLLRCLLCVRDQHDLFRLHPLLADEVKHALNDGIGLSCPWSRNQKRGTFGVDSSFL